MGLMSSKNSSGAYRYFLTYLIFFILYVTFQVVSILIGIFYVMAKSASLLDPI